METFRSHNENSQLIFISGAVNPICLHGPDDALRAFVEHVHMLLGLEAEHELNEDVVGFSICTNATCTDFLDSILEAILQPSFQKNLAPYDQNGIF